MLIQSGQKLLFIGDSITDCGRLVTRNPLGSGYVKLVDELLAARYPDRKIAVVNRGVSGDTVRHLEARWERDVIAERPDWLAVSIGINDVWRQIDHLAPGVPVDEYEATYRRLLSQAKEAIGSRLILMETSVIEEDLDSVGNRMLIPYNEAIHRLASEFDAVLVPIHEAFRRAISARPGFAWTTDGVHPNDAGHALMAITVLGSLGW